MPTLGATDEFTGADISGTNIKTVDGLTAIPGAGSSRRPVPEAAEINANPPASPCLLAMSTSNSGGVQELTQEEQILHHHAAMVKKDLEAYHAYSRSQDDWKDLFKSRLASFFLANHFYKSVSDSFRGHR